MNNPSILYLSKQDIISIGGGSSDLYVKALSNALELHAKKDIVQPLKPYLRVDEKNGHIADRIIAMPAYVGGEAPVSGIKWIGSKADNPQKRGMERASALIVLNDPETNYPIAVMEGSLISGMRTAAVTVLAAKYLAREGFTTVACMGSGIIARMQLQSLLEQFPSITTIHLFDLNPEAAGRLANELTEKHAGLQVIVSPDAETAVRQGDLVVTCTVTDKPYIPFSWLKKGAFVSNISIMDVEKEVFLKADKVVVDDWDQCNREKKVINQLVLEGTFSREKLHAELGEILTGARPGRENEDEIILLNPMGLAIEDIASAHEVYQRAVRENAGTRLNLY
ncbi:2,3-diaminopropionate biosynthesis protein SbnB [Tumebacillus avium]|nr:2,3-diaminopropionate biosynthesis protein SbnB [Tumebacillus avium]